MKREECMCSAEGPCAWHEAFNAGLARAAEIARGAYDAVPPYRGNDQERVVLERVVYAITSEITRTNEGEGT